MSTNTRSFLITAGLIAVASLPLLAFAQQTQGTFVPLTNIPAFQNAAGTTGDLKTFLNQLYLICIGVAVVITILQLIRAGVMYTMGDSGFSKVEEAKHLISVSLLGLLLVLSPYIIFKIINPDIVSFNIKTDLQSTPGTQIPSAPPPESNGSSWYCFGIFC